VTSNTRMYTPHRGLGNSSSRMCRILSAISASIVTRLASLALKGNCLHLNIHQHLGYSVHVTWRIGAVTMRYRSAADRPTMLPATSSLHYTTSYNTQSSAPEDGQNKCLKPVELTGIISKPLLLHLVGCLHYLYQ
jgi:hypothetical protein